jgi:mono/diheme cytochrome c family protein
MKSRNRWPRPTSRHALALLSFLGIAATARFLPAQADDGFDQIVKPFFTKNCVSCHNSELSTAGIRVDQLDAKLEDRHLQAWEAIRHRIQNGTMPPQGLPQPTAAERQQAVDWITKALAVARRRVPPKNGMVRRLTVSQYKNTLRELLKLDDDLTVGLPPDAVSKDGFLNN